MQFTENEIPFQTLDRLGLTREMIEDLPVRITNDILEGRRSPVLPIMVVDNDGNEVKSRSRFKLIRKEDGDVDALFYPEIEKADLRLFSEQSRSLLEQGKIIVGTIPDKNGNMVRSFVQIDNETNQVLSAPVQVIARNLHFISEDIHLSEAEFNNLQNGEPVTFVRDDDDEPITVGIDLNNRTGVRVSSGDAKIWSEQRTRDWDKFTFGIYGCWVMGDDGNEVKSRSRFKLIRKEDGNVDALFYPEIEKADLRLFSEQNRALLEKGKTIIATIPDKNGSMVRSFVQIDNETNQVLSAPVQVIARNLQFISEDIHLSEAEFNNLQNGEPVTFVRDDDDEPITVGIDLSNRTGVRVSPGDAKMWSEQRTRDWDKFTFGIYGCWVMGEDGNLDYVKEEDYTDELWNEQRKAGLRSMGHMR